MDAGSSLAAPGRSIVAHRWSVYSKADHTLITSSVDGQRTPVWLGPGEYSLELVITDTSGQTATAKKGFAVGDVAETLAHISAPASGFMEVADGGSVEVQLSASGSKAGPGRTVTSYSWSVIRLPDNSQVASGSGPAATVSLPGGSYKVTLTVSDSAGGRATASKEVAVGGKGSSGATAVITWPPTVVTTSAAPLAADATGARGVNSQESSSSSSSRVNGDGTTLVALDAAGSTPSRAGSEVQQYVWAVLSMPSKQPVANATGRLATVRLPAGAYQAGLLVLDADGGTATARKNFIVQQGAVSNRAPVIPQDLQLSGAVGDLLVIPGVMDPDGDAVSISWSLMNQASGRTAVGKGAEVVLQDGLVSPGSHLLLITAADGRGGEGSGTAHVTVTPAAPGSRGSRGAKAGSVSVAAAGKATAAGSSQTPTQQQDIYPDDATDGDAPNQGTAAALSSSWIPTDPSGVASIFSGPSGPKKLPVLSMPQGSMVTLDAAAFHLLPPKAKVKAFTWELQQRGTGQQVATVYGRMGRFELPALASYNVKLLATDTDGMEYSSTGSIRVVDASESGGLAAALEAAGQAPVVAVSGQCGPFKGRQYTAVELSCPGLEVSAAESAALQWAWKVTPTAGIHARGAAGGSSSAKSDSENDDSSDSAKGGSGAFVQAKLGQAASFLGLAPGLYRVEVAVGVGGPPSSRNTAYYLATFLQVSATRNLTFSVPSSAVCAGQPVSLDAPLLQLSTELPEAEFEWQVTREQSAAQAAAAGGTGNVRTSTSTSAMHGTGKTFGFTVQPGRYEVSLLAKLPDGARLSGQGVVKAKVCVGCRQDVVDIVLPRGACTASQSQAASALSGVLPQGLEVSWAEGSDLGPGLRNVTVLAKLPGARARDASGRVVKVPSCRAQVNIKDEEGPVLTVLHEDGLCLSPPNNKWSCWHAHQLVSISDNCQSGAALSSKLSCSSSSSRSGASTEGNNSGNSSSCKVLSDGRVCIQAAEAGQVTMVTVAARDASGNTAQPADVAVSVLDTPQQQQQCSTAELRKPGVAAKLAKARHAAPQRA